MNNESLIPTCQYADTIGGPSLQRVEMAAGLQGLLLQVSVCQRYRNESDGVREIVYTFPLPMESVLLGLSVSLGSKTYTGVVVEQKESTRRYEEAMAEGDTPVLLERSGDGLWTLNLGNLKPGEEAEIRFRYARLASFENGRVRLVLPTCVAPRYGDPQRQGGMQPHQVPTTDVLAAEYPVAVTLDVQGSLARGEIACHTHPVSVSGLPDGGTRLVVSPQARMDRDLVFSVRAEAGHTATVAPDALAADGSSVVAAAFELPASVAEPRPCRLKILLDCSGSMAGDSIRAARAGLQAALDELGPQDQVSVSRFGNHVEHHTRRLVPARPSSLLMLRGMLSTLEADMGGTELELALDEVYGLRGAGDGTGADVLLVTDGEVWNVEPLIEAARAGGHRIFAVGVGHAPVESLLRRLAEASGGACECATPGEDISAAVRRLIARMRGTAWRELQVGLDGEPAWTLGPSGTVFAGDTVVVFAGLPAGIAQEPRVRLTLRGADGAQHVLEARCERARADGQGDWPRLAAARRLAQMDADSDAALDLALRYQLVTQRTNLYAVVERADGEKVQDFARLEQVPQMMVAGAVAACAVPGELFEESLCAGRQYLETRVFGAPLLNLASDVKLSIADFREFRRAPQPAPSQLKALLRLAAAVLSTDAWQQLAERLDGRVTEDGLRDLFEALGALGFSRAEAWAAVVRWACAQDALQLSATAEQRLDVLLQGVGAVAWTGAVPVLAKGLPDVTAAMG